MTFEQVAARLGITVHQVAGIDDHPAGQLVRLVNGSRWLLTDTVARRYVPDVDDAPTDAGDLEDPEGDSASPDGEDAVPSGSVDEVLTWVGEDRERAAQAREAEQAKSSPRKTLLARLDELLAEEA